MRKSVLIGQLILCYNLLRAQCLIPSSNADTLFPVTNVYNTSYSPYADIVYRSSASVFNIAAHNGTYYLFGNFTNLSRNQGQALVLDSLSNTIRTSQKWRINGTVSASVEDGQGGFFICGNFTRIGDSSRSYLAQINNLGEPTAWNPKVNNQVNALFKKGDTLFIGGSFSSIFSRPRGCMALYSLSGDSLLNTIGPNMPPLQMFSVNCFLIQNDTLLYGGVSGTGMAKIMKYNLKDNVLLPWQLAFPEYGEILQLQFNKDSSQFVYACDYNGKYIKGVNTITGAEQYNINVYVNHTATIPQADIFGLKVVGDKAYAVGYFEQAVPKSGIFFRKGFFAFDASDGTILQDDLKCDGYPTFLETINGRLYLSGKFTQVNGASRENFAVVDTDALQVDPWQLAPTDPLTSLAFSKGSVFIGGHFNGINSIHRNGFAAIDSATNAILPWTATNSNFAEGKRMLIKGDTLFVLGITSRPSSCMVGDFNSAFQMISLTTGATINSPGLGFSRVNDILIDSDYMYVSGDYQVRRFSLPSMTKDPVWGINFSGAGGEHAPMCLIIRGSEMYSVGDNRFTEPCTTLPRRNGWFISYDKATGLPTHYYSFEGANSNYDQITFEHAILAGNKLYIQGYFNTLNGKSRNNFVALDVNTGTITDWSTPFSEAGKGKSFQTTTDLKLYNGKIWFGAPQEGQPNSFKGFGAIDTTSGELMPGLFNLDATFYDYLKTKSFQDFIFHGNNFVGVGGFDWVNGQPYTSMVQTPIVTSQSPLQAGTSIEGPDTIYVGTSKKYYVLNGNITTNSYHWNYSASGLDILSNGSDSVWLKANSISSGQLSATAQSYCGAPALLQKNIIVAMPPLPPVPGIKNVKDKCQMDYDDTARLVNPPSDVTISIALDGAPVSYNSTDSSFIYFQKIFTAAGAHTISVKYTNVSGTSSKDSTFIVNKPINWTVSISTPSTSICAGASATFTATTSLTGPAPAYQWQVHGVNVGNNEPQYTSNTLFNGALVKVIVTPVSGCISPIWNESNTITMSVANSFTPNVSISGTVNVKKGDVTAITATINNGGTNPTFKWQDSTSLHSWRDISAATQSTLNYAPSATGDKIRCLLTSNLTCALPSTVTSNAMSFNVDVATSVNTVPAAQYGIRCFPNPATSTLIIDSLSITHKWQTLDILSIDGKQKMISMNIRGQQQLSVPLNELPSGYYLAVLRRKSGESVYLRFLKM